MHYNNEFRQQLRDKIRNFSNAVFSRNDLTQDYSNKEQLRLNRALRAFMDEGLIIKVAHGLFAKAERLELPGGHSQSVLTKNFESMALEALGKLNIQWEFSQAIQDYNSGKTTQVPAVFSVRLKSRYRGSIKAEGRTVVFEGGVNAR